MREAKFLAAMDYDSTLIRQEIIDELARQACVEEKVAAMTRLAMEGKLDFEQALKKRCELLAGLDEKKCDAVARRIRPQEGARELLDYLHENGFFVAVISGSLEPVAGKAALRNGLKIDSAIFNSLEIKDGKLTGKVQIHVGNDKAAILKKLQAELGIEKERTIAIGDGKTDIPLFENAGLSIAFNARPVAKKAADKAIEDDLEKAIPIIESWLQRKTKT